MRSLRLALAGLLLLVTACATPVPAPQTPAQTLAAADLTYTAIVEALVVQRDAGTLDQEDVDRLRPALLHADALLDAAHAAVLAGDQATAAPALAAALAALTSLQRRLADARGS